LVDRWSLIYNSEGDFEYVAVGKNDRYFVVNEFLFESYYKDLE